MGPPYGSSEQLVLTFGSVRLGHWSGSVGQNVRNPCRGYTAWMSHAAAKIVR
jgi:hypothetical protein